MRRIAMVVVVAASLLGLFTRLTQAQVCGDADGSGSLTVADGVQTLRAAAGLSSSCAGSVCDVDGSGGVTVADGVNVLRAAAALPASLTCGAEIAGFVSGVQTADGGMATLDVGAAPVPGPDAPATVGQPQGNTNVIAGGSNEVTVPFDASGAGAQVTAGGAGAGDLELIIAVADLDANLFDGFFRIPLDASSGQQTITVLLPQNLGSQSFLLCPATRSQGVLSQYAILRQDPVAVTSGRLQVSLSFQPSQDLDLHLVEPGGEEIFFGHTSSAAGGTLDLDSNPGCSIDGVNNENITYPASVTPPSGQYIVRVDFFRSCDNAGAAFTVVVNNRGARSTFSGRFSASEADQGGAGSGREITRFTFIP